MVRNDGHASTSAPVWGLGLDAGGTQTRWALADRSGNVVAEGQVAAMSGLQLHHAAGIDSLRASMQALRAAVAAHTHGLPLAMYGGFTGLADVTSAQAMQALILAEMPIVAGWVTLTHDMDIAYRAVFAPGQGYLVYAGTGSIASFVDAHGEFHRAGGRGPALGDEGGGYWIAKEALAHIWRMEDQQPGAWKQSPMAQRIFQALGGNDWASSRHFMYASDRGAIGALALQVGASAGDDPVADRLLQRAGVELAQLAQHLLHRFGPRPVVLGGRAQCVSPLIESSMRQALPPDVIVRAVADLQAHCVAARGALVRQ